MAADRRVHIYIPLRGVAWGGVNRESPYLREIYVNIVILVIEMRLDNGKKKARRRA